MTIMFNATLGGRPDRAAIISIVTLFARTGATLQQIMDAYEQMTNEELAPSRAECIALIRAIDELVCIGGRYHSTSDKSQHIRQLIRQQNPGYGHQNM